MTNAAMATDWNAKRDALIAEWLQTRGYLADMKEKEMELRKQIQEMLFPNPVKGTQRYELGNGYNIKLVHKLNYKLGDKDLTDKNGAKVKVQDQVENIMAAIEKCGNEGPFLVDRLIKTEYSLAEGEYNKLDVTSQIKKLIDSILVTSPASPTLELEEPKEKK